MYIDHNKSPSGSSRRAQARPDQARLARDRRTDGLAHYSARFNFRNWTITQTFEWIALQYYLLWRYSGLAGHQHSINIALSFCFVSGLAHYHKSLYVVYGYWLLRFSVKNSLFAILVIDSVVFMIIVWVIAKVGNK